MYAKRNSWTEAMMMREFPRNGQPCKKVTVKIDENTARTDDKMTA